MNSVKVMCQVKRTKTVMSIQIEQMERLFDECEELIKIITLSIQNSQEHIKRV